MQFQKSQNADYEKLRVTRIKLESMGLSVDTSEIDDPDGNYYYIRPVQISKNYPLDGKESKRPIPVANLLLDGRIRIVNRLRDHLEISFFHEALVTELSDRVF